MRTFSRGLLSNIIVLVLFVCGCGSDGYTNLAGPPQPAPVVQLSVPNDPLEVGGQSIISINVQDLDEQIFAISIRINFDASVVAIDEGFGLLAGDFFGSTSISILQVEENVIYLSVSAISSAEKSMRTGILGGIALTGLSPGECNFSIGLDNMRLIDAEGTNLEIPDLEVFGVSIVVQ